MMETNKRLESDLAKAGQELLDAAYRFWRLHQVECGRAAVVWLTDDDGKMVIFTRGEYRGTLMQNIEPIVPETPLA